MGTTLTTALFLGLGFASCGGAVTHVRTLGEVKVDSLCDDGGRCDVRGDAFANTLEDADSPRIYLASGQGPEQYLGKVAPERNTAGALITCGANLDAGDYLSSAPSMRAIKLAKKSKARLMSSLRSHLAKQLGAHPIMQSEAADKNLELVVEAVLAEIKPAVVNVDSATYWLSDAGFEKRVGLCGEEHYENIIYSMTVLELSAMFQRDLEAALRHGLESALRKPPEDFEDKQPEAAPREFAPEPIPVPVLPDSKLQPGSEKAKTDAPVPAPTQKTAAPAPPVPEPKVAKAEKRRKKRKHKREAKAPEVAQVPAPAAPGVADKLAEAPKAEEPKAVDPAVTASAEVARAAISALADDTRVVAALGFDER